MASAVPHQEEAAQSCPEQALSGTKEQVPSRGAVSSRMQEVLDVSQETLQSSQGAAGLGLEPELALMGVCGAEAVLGRAEGGSLPIGNEELARLAVCEEGSDVMPLEQRRYSVSLGSLPEELGLFVQLHSPGRIQQVWQGMRGALAQLHCILQLTEAFKQGFNQKLREKLHQMWLEWSRKYLNENVDANPADPEEMVCLALLTARRIGCSGVVAAVQSLPCSLRDSLQRALHDAFSAADSSQDLASRVLSQSQRELAVIQENMEELLDYLKNNTPLSWLLGPLSPRGDESSQEEEEEAAGAGHLETSSTSM
ncbi:perilipin-3-like [Acridotheres tristis]